MSNILTTNLEVFETNIGKLDSVDIKNSSLNLTDSDKVLFTATKRDRNEISKYKILKINPVTFTVVPDRFEKNNLDIFWSINSSVIYKNSAEVLFSKKEVFDEVFKELEEIFLEDEKSYGELKKKEKNREVDLYLKYLLFKTYIENSSIQGKRAIKKEVSSSIGKVKQIVSFNSKSKECLVIELKKIEKDKKVDTFIKVFNIENITSKEEFENIFEKCKEDIPFAKLGSKRDSREFTIANRKFIVNNLTKNFGREYFLILQLKDKLPKAVFDKNDILDLDIEQIEDEQFLKIPYKELELNAEERVKSYRKFLKNIKKFSNEKSFVYDFANIILSLKRNFFLKKKLKSEMNSFLKKGFIDGDRSEYDIKYRSSFNILTYFYEYLLKKRVGIEDIFESQLKVLLYFIYSDYFDIDNIDDRLVVNIYLFLKNNILSKANYEFLSLFEDFEKSLKIQLEDLEKIEKCLENFTNLNDEKFLDYKELKKDLDRSRCYDIEYLELVLDLVKIGDCSYLSDSLEKTILEKKNQLNLKYYEDIDLNNKSEKESIDEFQDETVKLLKYIENFFDIYNISEIKRPEVEYFNFKLLDDLIKMFAVSFPLNSNNTNAKAVELIRKLYLKKPKYMIDDWNNTIVNLILDTLKNYESLKQLGFEESFEYSLEELIEKSSFCYVKVEDKPDNFITKPTARAKIKKYFTISENNGDKHYYITLFKELFFKEVGLIIKIFEIIDEIEAKRDIDFFQKSFVEIEKEFPKELEDMQDSLDKLKVIFCTKDAMKRKKLDKNKLCLQILKKLKV